MDKHAHAIVRENIERLEARIPSSLKKMFLEASNLEGRTLTDFVLQAATEAARRVIREHEILDLSQRDQVAFAEAILNPPEANPALKMAARRYRRRSGR
jgi:uncharacterized protein (DUF1778 family)